MKKLILLLLTLYISQSCKPAHNKPTIDQNRIRIENMIQNSSDSVLYFFENNDEITEQQLIIIANKKMSYNVDEVSFRYIEKSKEKNTIDSIYGKQKCSIISDFCYNIEGMGDGHVILCYSLKNSIYYYTEIIIADDSILSAQFYPYDNERRIINNDMPVNTMYRTKNNSLN